MSIQIPKRNRWAKPLPEGDEELRKKIASALSAPQIPTTDAEKSAYRQTQTTAPTASSLDQGIRDTLAAITHPKPYVYDPSQDAVYQKLASVLQGQARDASEDAMGQYAAMTGGMPSSAAVSAAAGAGSSVREKLADVLSSREATAYDRYQDEQTSARQKLSTLLTLKEYEDSRADAEWSKKLQEEAAKQSATGNNSSTNTNTGTNQGELSQDTTPTNKYTSWIESMDLDLTPIEGELPVWTGAIWMEYLSENYPSDAYDRMFAVCQYLYDNHAITETQYLQLLEDSGVLEVINELLKEGGS